MAEYRFDFFDATLDRAQKWLENQPGFTWDQLDGSGPGKKDFIIEKEELIYFVYNSPDWKKFLPAMDRMKLVHPLDARGIRQKIKRRAHDLAIHINSNLSHKKIVPQSTVYCDNFVPIFFEQGLASYTKGGLGFSYPFPSQQSNAELTAAQAFEGVLNPKKPFGSCTEAVEKISTSLAMVAPQCGIDALLTQNHAFARYQTVDLDPSRIGKVGWEKKMTPAKFASLHYSTLAANATDRYTRFELLQIAKAIDPENAYAELVWGHSYVENLKDEQPAGIQKITERWAAAIRLAGDDVYIYTDIARVLGLFKKPSLALDVAFELFDKNPSHPYAILLLKNLLVKKDLLPSVITRFEKRYPHLGYHKLFAATKKTVEENKVIYSTVLALNPLNIYCLHGLAHLYLNESNLEMAKMFIQRAIAIAPNFPGTYYLLSQIEAQKNNVQLAYDAAKREMLSYLGNTDGTLAFAQAAMGAGDFRLALHYAKLTYKTLEQNKQPRFHVHLMILKILGELGQSDQALIKAEATLQRLKTAGYGTEEILALKIYLLYLKDDQSQAMHVIEEAQEKFPGSTYIECLKCMILKRLGSYHQALHCARNLVKNNPEFVEASLMLGEIYLDLNQTERAKQVVEKVLIKNPYDMVALSLNGMIKMCTASSRVEKQEAWEALRLLFKEHKWFLGIDAMYSLLLGNKEAALARALLAHKFDRRDCSALFVMGTLALEKNAHDKAQAYAEKILEYQPNSVLGHILDARLAVTRGNLGKAEAAALLALKYNPFINSNFYLWDVYVLLSQIYTLQGRHQEATAIMEEQQRMMKIGKKM